MAGLFAVKTDPVEDRFEAARLRDPEGILRVSAYGRFVKIGFQEGLNHSNNLSNNLLKDGVLCGSVIINRESVSGVK